MKPIRIGTRKSRLAMAQATMTRDRLCEAFPRRTFELVQVQTTGDRTKTVKQLRASPGAFTKELEKALLGGKIDVAVHSLKDLPTTLPEGLKIGAMLPREDPSDVVITRNGRPLAELPAGSTLGTGSARRKAFLRAAYPMLRIAELRGNLDTRIEKLKAKRSKYDAIVVALAGLRRLYGENPPCPVEILPTEILPPAPGQGAVCLQIRERDPRLSAVMERIDHEPTRRSTVAERAILHLLQGGCNVPISALGTQEGGVLRLSCWVATPSGDEVFSEYILGDPEEPEALAHALQVKLNSRGARRAIDEIRKAFPIQGNKPGVKSLNRRRGRKNR